jgi:hypothetical protein
LYQTREGTGDPVAAQLNTTDSPSVAIRDLGCCENFGFSKSVFVGKNDIIKQNVVQDGRGGYE